MAVFKSVKELRKAWLSEIYKEDGVFDRKANKFIKVIEKQFIKDYKNKHRSAYNISIDDDFENVGDGFKRAVTIKPTTAKDNEIAKKYEFGLNNGKKAKPVWRRYSNMHKLFLENKDKLVGKK